MSASPLKADTRASGRHVGYGQKRTSAGIAPSSARGQHRNCCSL